jgi:hypothetical protein
VLSSFDEPRRTALRLRLQMFPPALTAPPNLVVGASGLSLAGATLEPGKLEPVVVSWPSGGRSELEGVKTRGTQLKVSASSMVGGQPQAKLWLAARKAQESEQSRTRHSSNKRSGRAVVS